MDRNNESVMSNLEEEKRKEEKRKGNIRRK